MAVYRVCPDLLPSYLSLRVLGLLSTSPPTNFFTGGDLLREKKQWWGQGEGLERHGQESGR